MYIANINEILFYGPHVTYIIVLNEYIALNFQFM